MRYVNIDRINPGDILAKDIVDGKGNILLKASSDMILKENIILRLKSKGIRGLYILDEISKDVIIEETIPNSVRMMTIQALEDKNIQQTELIAQSIVKNFKSNVEVDLNRMMDGVSYYERALNIAELCLSLGKKLNYSINSLNNLVASALLSDIGLIMTNEEKSKVLEQVGDELKQRILSYEKEETYTLIGKLAVASAGVDSMVIHSVYLHKENEDGTGVTRNLLDKLKIEKNYEIRDTAKIIHICSDYIDFLIKNNDFSVARDMIQKGILDKKYNYELASAFLKHIPMYPIGTIVNLSNGLKVIVLSNNDGYPTAPIIQLESGDVIDLTKTLNIVIEGLDNQNIIKSRVA